MNTASVIDTWLPIIITLLSAGAFTPLLIKALQLLEAAIAHITNATWRSWAQVAVHDTEQRLATAPSAEKKATAVSFLRYHGIPATAAGELVEASVHVMNEAAAQALASQVPLVAPTPVVVNVPASPTAPPAAVDTSTIAPLVAGELNRIASALIAPVPDPAPPIQDSPKPLMAVRNIAVPPGLPSQPPSLNGTAGDTPAEPVAATGAQVGG